MKVGSRAIGSGGAGHSEQMLAAVQHTISQSGRPPRLGTIADRDVIAPGSRPALAGLWRHAADVPGFRDAPGLSWLPGLAVVQASCAHRVAARGPTCAGRSSVAGHGPKLRFQCLVGSCPMRFSVFGHSRGRQSAGPDPGVAGCRTVALDGSVRDRGKNSTAPSDVPGVRLASAGLTQVDLYELERASDRAP